ncbi:hypothetical protein HWV54_00310 [Bartonella alsatica]|uniref:Uncharacterized protein n=1 Tax=Bartonella alsatica TaxID=52764 RepID=A0ABX6QEZ1_9HYPH|nr:hypothetical protein [Bartonella alsatica]QLC51435.1 hypothetical protein HWV54_00310 [Bartonella alsatica]
MDRDEKGKIIYLTDENGQYIKDSHGQKIPHSHYLTAEEKKQLQAGSDGKVHVFFNGILRHQMKQLIMRFSLLIIKMNRSIRTDGSRLAKISGK